MESRSSKLMILGFATCSLISLVISTGLLGAQAAPELTQDTIDKRVAEIMEHALQQGAMTTSEGVHAAPMRANTTLAELKEIKTFGPRAIGALSKYFDSTEYRAQTLAVNLVGAIGGKEALNPLSYAAERCVSRWRG